MTFPVVDHFLKRKSHIPVPVYMYRCSAVRRLHFFLNSISGLRIDISFDDVRGEVLVLTMERVPYTLHFSSYARCALIFEVFIVLLYRNR